MFELYLWENVLRIWYILLVMNYLSLLQTSGVVPAVSESGSCVAPVTTTSKTDSDATPADRVVQSLEIPCKKPQEIRIDFEPFPKDWIRRSYNNNYYSWVDMS